MSTTPKVGPQTVNPAHRATVHESTSSLPATPASVAQGREGTAEEAGRAKDYSNKFATGGFRMPAIARAAKEVAAESHFSNDSLNALGGALDLLNDAQAAKAVSNHGHDEIPANTLDQATGFMKIFTDMMKS
jgi:hypothetical protein